MNKLTKEELLQLDEVKEILTEHAEFIAKKARWVKSQFIDWSEEYKNSIIKKPEWEVLSFINSEQQIWKRCPDGKYRINVGEFSESLEGLLKYQSIHSIKRLSDGEIFTIGDKVKVHSLHGKDISATKENIFPITGFVIQNGTLVTT